MERQEAREVRHEEREEFRWTKQMEWEREHYKRKEAKMREKDTKDDQLREEKKKLVMDLLAQGKSYSKAESFLQLIYN